MTQPPTIDLVRIAVNQEEWHAGRLDAAPEETQSMRCWPEQFAAFCSIKPHLSILKIGPDQ